MKQRSAVRPRQADGKAHSSLVTGVRLGRLAPLASLAALALAGCGSTSSAPPSEPAAETTPATPVSTTPATSAPSSASASDSPEALLYESEAGSATHQLVALGGGPEGLTATPVASFADEASDESPDLSIYTFSPDLSKQAVISTTSDGSKVAGYVPANGGSFVNLSGHESGSYSDTPVIDEDPLFNPASGELWWTSAHHLWSSAVSEGTPHDHGVGSLGAFNAAGAPVPASLALSPDGRLTAIENTATESRSFVIGRSRVLTASCLRPTATAEHGELPALTLDAEEIVRQCPGSASVTFGETAKPACQSFAGFVSNSAFVCQTYEANSRGFELLTFKIIGSTVKIVHSMSLAPPTQMTLHESQVAPDGKSLWYVGVRNEPSADPPEQTSLYVIPTNSATSEPTLVSLTPATAISQDDQIIGWRWHGHLLPAITSGS